MSGFLLIRIQRLNVIEEEFLVFALAFCLALAFLAEVFGIADITGAYLAGIILCRLPERFYNITTRLEFYRIC